MRSLKVWGDMSEDEDLKRRMKELEYELHHPKNNYQKILLNNYQNFKKNKSKLKLKYIFLIWFVVGLGIFTGISFIVGAETLYLLFASVILTITSVSLILTSLILVLPTLVVIYLIYIIWKNLA